ncbi:hypothetical protein KEM54_002174 [Ascosphaera aggregata]|nr:hypothetical protein KEM54_002174 [Ascosphaera aggregata]
MSGAHPHQHTKSHDHTTITATAATAATATTAITTSNISNNSTTTTNRQTSSWAGHGQGQGRKQQLQQQRGPKKRSVDPLAEAEYPILLSDRLKKRLQHARAVSSSSSSSSSSSAAAAAAANGHITADPSTKLSKLFSLTYNHKPRVPLSTHLMQIFPSSKSSSPSPLPSPPSPPQQPQPQHDQSKHVVPFTLTIQEKGNPSQTWIYHGSHDPKTIREQQSSETSRTGNAEVNGHGMSNGVGSGGSGVDKEVVLIYDNAHKAFILEELDARLNFNMIKGPKEPDGKPSKRYERLEVTYETGNEQQRPKHDAPSPSKGQDENEGERGDDDDPDADNPYDWRHFAKKADEEEKETARKKSEKQQDRNDREDTASTRGRETLSPLLPPLESPAPSVRSTLSSSNAIKLEKSITPPVAEPAPTKPATTKTGSGKGKAGTTGKATAKAAETEKGTARTKSRTITDPLRPAPKRKPGRPAGSTSSTKANASRVKSAETMPKDDEVDDDDDKRGGKGIKGWKKENEYKDGDIIDIPSAAPSKASATKVKKSSTAAPAIAPSEEIGEDSGGELDQENKEDTLDIPQSTHRPSSNSNIEVVSNDLIIDWGTPPRERTPVRIDQQAFGFGQVDEDEEELEHVGLPSLIRAKREEEERRKRRSVKVEEEDDEEEDGDEDEDGGDGEGEGDGASEAESDMNAELEADIMAAFEDLDAEKTKKDATTTATTNITFEDEVRAKQSQRVIDDDESSVSEEE